MEDVVKIKEKKIKEIKITEISTDHEGDRVCVDLNYLLKEDEGLLVGNYNRSLFLIGNETYPSETIYDIGPRPFRVNAGVVSSYVYMPNGNTKYLVELKVGDKVLVSNTKGITRAVEITRLKIETRPMTLIKGYSKYDKDPAIRSDEDLHYFNIYRRIFKWFDPDTGEEIFEINKLKPYIKKKLDVIMEVATFVQSAETVRVVSAPHGDPIAVTALKEGMSIYAFINNPTLKARHFGIEYNGFCLEV